MRLAGLTYDPNRHGRPRWYVRIAGRKKRLEGLDARPPLAITDEVLAAYNAARAALEGERRPLRGAGTFAWLVEMYFRSAEFGRLAELTRRERRSVLGRLTDVHGHRLYADMEPRHVARLRDELEGEPARKRVKCLRYLFKWAIAAELVARNPAAGVALPRVATEGWTAWTPDDVLAFEARHPVGTRARLALALYQYTGARKSDVAAFGPANIRAGRIVWVQHKGRGIRPKRMSLPLVAPLRQVLDASPLGQVTFLETAYGKPFTIAGLGNWFRARCDEAGLDGLSAHGIRKGMGTLLAERECSTHEIMSILGVTLQMAEVYTRAAERSRMADSGFAKAFGDDA